MVLGLPFWATHVYGDKLYEIYQYTLNFFLEKTHQEVAPV